MLPFKKGGFSGEKQRIQCYEPIATEAARRRWYLLSLLTNKRLIPGLVGIQIDAEGVSVARVVRQAGRKPLVTDCDFRPWGGAAKEGVLSSVAADFNLKRSRCTTLLEIEDYSLLLTEAPDVPAEELRSAIRWRIKDLVDFHLGDATIDVFDVSSQRAQGKQRSMYVVAAKNAAIQRRVDICDEAGINLDVIDIPEMAQRNLASIVPEDVNGVVMLSLSATRGLLTITRQGEIYLSRRLELGTEQLQEDKDNRAANFDQVVLEVQRSLDYYDSHFQQAPIGHLVLSPAAAAVPHFVEYLATNLGVKTSVMSLSELVKYDPAKADVLEGKGLIALGAALRYEEKTL